MADRLRDSKVDNLTTKHQNLHGRRMTGAGDAVDDLDYVTLRQLRSGVQSIPVSKGGGSNTTTTIITPPVTTPAAPNLTSVSAAQIDFQFNGDPWFNFDITCTLPTGDPHYSELVEMHLYVTEVSTASGIARIVTKPSGGWGVSTYHLFYAIPTPTIAVTYHYEVRTVNSAGVETTPGVTGTLTITPAATANGPVAGTVAFAVSNPVVITENTSLRYRANDFTAHGILAVAITLLSSYGVQNITLYYSPDGGTTYFWTNWYPISGTTVTINLDKVCPLTNTSIKVAAVIGAYPGDPNKGLAAGSLPGGNAISPAFTFTGISAPSVNAITSASLGTLLALIDPDGTQDWGLSAVAFTDASPVIDPYAKTWRLIVRIGSLSGSVFTPATGPDGGNDALIAQGDINGSSHSVGGIAYWGYPGDTTKTVAQFRLEVFNSAGSATIQTPWSGVDSHFGYLTFGTGNGLLNAAGLDPTKLGNGVIVSSGTLNTTQPNPSTSLLQDFDFSYSAALGSVPKKWLFSGGVTIVSSGGPNNCPYANLPGSGAFMQQGFPVSSSQPLYFQASARGHGSGLLQMTCQFFDASGTFISTFNIGTVTGGAGIWSITAITGVLGASSVPSTAKTGRITFQVSGGVGDSWDFTQSIVRQVTQETNGGQTSSGEPTTIPSSGGNSGFILKSTTTSAVAYYGLGRIMMISPNGVNQVYIDLTDIGAVVQASFGSGGTLRSIWLDAASGVSRITQNRGGSLFAGVDTTITGHTVTGGIVTS